jgi:hypothetical protein
VLEARQEVALGRHALGARSFSVGFACAPWPRTPHVHFKILLGGDEIVTSQRTGYRRR